MPERATKEEQRVKGNPFFPDLSSIPAFDPTWQLRGLKVVNLYAQLVSQVSWGRNGLYLSKMNPSDPVEQQNTVSDKILQCQNDRRCKAIVAAWGRVPPTIYETYGNSESDRAASRKLINQRINGIVSEINASGKEELCNWPGCMILVPYLHRNSDGKRASHTPLGPSRKNEKSSLKEKSGYVVHHQCAV